MDLNGIASDKTIIIYFKQYMSENWYFLESMHSKFTKYAKMTPKISLK